MSELDASTRLGHGVPRYLIKHYFWVCFCGCFCGRLIFELVDCVKQIGEGREWGGIIQSIEDLNRKGGIEILGSVPTCAGTLVFSSPRTGTYTISSPGSQASDLDSS